MDQGHSIKQLCDHWWKNKHSGAREKDIRSVTEEFLQILGWETHEAIDSETSDAAYLVRGRRDETTIAFHVIDSMKLEPPSLVVERGMDYCDCTLMLSGEAHEDGYQFVAVTDFNRFYLYEVTSDELLIHADSPQQFTMEMMESLQKDVVDDFAFDDLHRSPRSLKARQLRCWCEDWFHKLSHREYDAERAADAILDRMVMMRFLYEHPICETEEWSFKEQFDEVAGLAFDGPAADAGKALLQLMGELNRRWGMSFFARDEQVERILLDEQVCIPMVKELALHGQAKFDYSTILESFNYGDASEKARVRLVPEHSEERESLIRRLCDEVLEAGKLEVDVLDEGYRIIVHWFERLLVRYADMETDFAIHAGAALAQGDGMDLLHWSRVENGNGPKDDGVLQFAVKNGFRIWYDSERQYRTARMIMYMYLIEWYEQHSLPCLQFPDVGTMLDKRPAMLESDKKQIYNPTSQRMDEWEDGSRYASS